MKSPAAFTRRVLLQGSCATLALSSSSHAQPPKPRPQARRMIFVVLDGGRLMHAGPLAGFSDAAPYVSVSVGPDGTAVLAGALGRRGLTVHADTDHVVVDFHGDHTYDQIRDTVAELGLPLLAMVAAQGFGAGAGNSVALYNIITGAATVGLQGREGEVLRKTGPVCLAYLAGGGLLMLAVALWFA